MTIYVDNHRQPARVGRHVRLWSHLFACPDDDDELNAFARSIGLELGWFQPGRFPHYDVTEFMRVKAIRRGAISIAPRAGMKLRLKTRKAAKNEQR